MNRPILPAVSRQAGAVSDSTSSGELKRQYTKRGAISKIACRSCRRRKTKCNSEKPTCQNCAARSEPCIYDFEESDRSLTALRDNVENLAEERNALDAVLRALQTGSYGAAMEIFHRLRAGSNLATVAQQVNASKVLTEVGMDAAAVPQNSNLSRLDQYEQLLRAITAASSSEQEEIVRRLKMSFDPASVLAAIRTRALVQPLQSTGTPSSIERHYSSGQRFGLVTGTGNHIAFTMDVAQTQASTSLSPEPWTEVTANVDFIEHLFSLYFSWQHTFFQNFPEDLFRADYATGGTKYCSRFLVNAICASGCLLSRRKETFQVSNDPRTAGLAFFDAALHQLREVPGSSICTVAGLSLLANFEAARGRLSAMWGYCGQSGRMALDLSLHLQKSLNAIPEDSNLRTEEYSKMHSFWGCFITDQVTSFTLGRLPQIPIHSVTTSIPEVDDVIDAKPWIAYYNGSEPVIPGACSSTFREVVSLCTIVNSTLSLFFSPAKGLSGALLIDEYNKYLRWKENLPQIVSTTHEAPPHILCAHLLWHSAVLLLFRPFLRVKIADSQGAPPDICRKSANAISELFGRHTALYHLQGISSFQVQCLLTACTIHIIHIPAIASTNYFIDACNSLHALVGRNNWAKSSISVLKELVTKWDRILPGAAEAALYQDELVAGNLIPQPSPPDSRNRRISFSSPRQHSTHSRSTKSGEVSTPQLFAPSASQPAPLLRPTHNNPEELDTLMEDSLHADQEFEGLDFLSEDWLDPFMGAYMDPWLQREPN